MQPPRTNLALSLIILAPLVNACTLPGKVCIGDCDEQSDEGEGTVDGEAGGETLTGGADESDASSDAELTTTSAMDSGDETGPAASCFVPDTDPPDLCGAFPAAVDFCFIFGSGGKFPQGITSVLPAQLDGGGVDLLVAHPDGTVTAQSAVSEPVNATPSKLWALDLPPGDHVLTSAGVFDESAPIIVLGRLSGQTGGWTEIRTDGAGNALAGQLHASDLERRFGPVFVDWNQDDDLDLVEILGAEGFWSINIVTGEGDGDFTSKGGPIDDPEDARVALGAFGPGDATDDLVFVRSTGAVEIRGDLPDLADSQQFDLGPDVLVHAVEVADLDGDARDDLVALVDDTATATTSVRVALHADGFAQVAYPVVCGARALAIGRLDADDIPDIAVLGPNDTSLTIRRNDGNGGFNRTTSVDFFDPMDRLLVFDITGDGRDDIVAASTIDGSWSFRQNGAP